MTSTATTTSTSRPRWPSSSAASRSGPRRWTSTWGRPPGGTGLRSLIDDELLRWDDDVRRGRRSHETGQPRPRRRAGVAEPGRSGTPHRPARRSRRLGDRGELPRLDLREAPHRTVRLPPRELPRRRPRRTHPHQAPRRLLRQPPQAGPDRGAPGRAARRRITPAHRARRPEPRWSRDGEHPSLHRCRLHPSRRTGGALHPERRRRRVPGCRGPVRLVDPLRRRTRLGQDDLAVLLCRRAGPVAAGGHRRGGVRDRRPAAERRADADAVRDDRTARRSISAGWWRVSCAWRRMWPWSARSAIERLFPSC